MSSSSYYLNLNRFSPSNSQSPARIINAGGSNIVSRTDIGSRKEKNEDYVIQFDQGVIMCDGVGGAPHGEYTASLVANLAFKHLNSSFLEKLTVQYRQLKPLEDVLDRFACFLNYDTINAQKSPYLIINNKLVNHARGFTTLSMAVEIEDNLYLCFVVGDSLIYKKSSLGIDRVTGSHCKADTLINIHIKRAKLKAAFEGIFLDETKELVKAAHTKARQYPIDHPTLIQSAVPMDQDLDYTFNLVRLAPGESLFVTTDGISDNIIMENIDPRIASVDYIMQLASDVQQGNEVQEELVGSYKPDNMSIAEIKYKEYSPATALELQEKYRLDVSRNHKATYSNYNRDWIPTTYMPTDALSFSNFYQQKLDRKLHTKGEDDPIHFKTVLTRNLFEEELKLNTFISQVSLNNRRKHNSEKIERYNKECSIILNDLVNAAIEFNDLKIISNLLLVLRSFLKTKTFSNYNNILYLLPTANFEEAIKRIKLHLLNNFDFNKLNTRDVNSFLAIKSVFGVEGTNIEIFKKQFDTLRRNLREYYYDYKKLDFTLDPVQIEETSTPHGDANEMYSDLFESLLIYNDLSKELHAKLKPDLQRALDQIATVDLINFLNIENNYNYFAPLVENLANRFANLGYSRKFLITDKIHNPTLKLHLFTHLIYSLERKSKLSLSEEIKKFFGLYFLNKMSFKNQLNFVLRYFRGDEFAGVFQHELIEQLCFDYPETAKSLTPWN